ncbi:MAG: ribulose-phosphate 3-epimerase [Brevinema sp.]
MSLQILPSIFAADFSDLPSALKKIEASNISMIHYDVMDNHFVPNISFGIQFVQQVMQASQTTTADIHLMIDLPGYYERFLELSPKVLTVHYEAMDSVVPLLRNIRKHNVLAGISIKPSTPVSILKSLEGEFDLLLIMSVEPGFSFQSFIPESLNRIREARELFGNDLIIEADGGITRENMRSLKEAGLDWFVMGGGFFKDPNPQNLVDNFRES